MQLSPQEIQKLELYPPLSIIIWQVGHDGIPRCVLKSPDKNSQIPFTVIFDKFVLFEKIGLERVRKSLRQKEAINVTHRYRVVRYVDISVALNRPSLHEPFNSRGSWVEALESDQVIYEEREIPLTTRTLRHPRYADGNRERGTNQIEVEPHTRRIPMRADQKAITKITAKHYPKKKGKTES